MSNTRLAFRVNAAAIVAAGLVALPAAQAGVAPATRTDALHSRPMATEQTALAAYGKLPLAFVANAGQTDTRIRYSAQGAGFSLGFARGEALFAFTKGTRGHALALRFLGANQARPEGTRPLEGKVHYLRGNDSAKWRTSLPTYAELVYRDLWPGIDLAFTGRSDTLKYEFRLAPGANARAIRLAYRGADRLSLGKSGALRIHTPLGVLQDTRPATYQLIGGKRMPVKSRFVISAGGAYGFAVGNHEPGRPLVIDPGLLYSTYLGGGGSDIGLGIAVDSVGNAHVTGRTASADFPTTAGAFDPGLDGGNDAFVTKLNPAGSALVYSTYLGGGSSDDQGNQIALDSAGNAYVASRARPTSPSPWAPSTHPSTATATDS